MSAHSVYVSLTTISRRLQDVHVTVKSILNQSLPPTHIFLYISEDPFLLDTGISRSLLETTEVWTLAQAHPDKFTITYVPNMGPSRKLVHLLQDSRVNPDDCIITVDDDNEYNPDCLERLVSASRENPDAVISNMGCKVNVTYMYSTYYGSNTCRKPFLDRRNMAIGFGGVLYKPRFFGGVNVLEMLPTLSLNEVKVDDILFKLLTHRQGAPVRVLNYYPVVVKPQPLVSLYNVYNIDRKRDGSLANNDVCFRSLCGILGVNLCDFLTFYPVPFTNADTDCEAKGRMEKAWGLVFSEEPFHLLRTPAFTGAGAVAGTIFTHATLLGKLAKGSTLGMYTILSDSAEPVEDAPQTRDRFLSILRFLADRRGEWDLFVGGPTDIQGPLRIVSENPRIVECTAASGLDMCIYSDKSVETVAAYAAAAAKSLDPLPLDAHLSQRHTGRIWVPYPPLCRPWGATQPTAGTDSLQNFLREDE